MTVDRLTRIDELLRREIADMLFQIMNESAFDLASVTITRVITSPTLRTARVLVSIREHQGERERMLALLRRHGPEIQRRINADVVMKYTPRLSFELDLSIEKGDHVLGVLAELERESAPSADQTPTSPAPSRPDGDA